MVNPLGPTGWAEKANAWLRPVKAVDRDCDMTLFYDLKLVDVKRILPVWSSVQVLSVHSLIRLKKLSS